MAKASVKLTCSKCGQEFTATKDCHNRSEASNWEAYMSRVGGVCTTCWAAEKKAEKEASIQENRIKLAEAVKGCPVAFPNLMGSEKQIAWANDLRNGVVAAMINKKFYWDKAEDMARNDPEIKVEWDKLFMPSAKWWIDNRGKEIFGYFRIGE
jgi:hypothetical protein